MSSHGYKKTTTGKDEEERSSSIKERTDGSIHGHVWLPSGHCAAFIFENGRAYVEADERRYRAWDKVRAKAWGSRDS